MVRRPHGHRAHRQVIEYPGTVRGGPPQFLQFRFGVPMIAKPLLDHRHPDPVDQAFCRFLVGASDEV